MADEAGEGGGLLAVEVGFEAVADGFMEQDAGPAGAEDDFHFAGGSGDGAELEDGSAGGFAGQVLGALGAGELVEAGAAAAAGGAFGGDGAFLGDDEDVEAAEGLGVAGEGAVGGGDEDAAEFLGVAGADLDDARVEGAGGAVGAEDELEAGGEVEIEAAERNGIEIGGGGFDESLHGLFGRAGGDEGGGAGGVEQALGAEIVGVGVAGALAGEDADAAAGAGALAGGFDDLLVDAEGGGGDGLEVEVGVVAAGGEGFAQAALEQALGDAEFLEKITFVAWGWGKRPVGHRGFSLRRNPDGGFRTTPPFLSWCAARSYSSARAAIRARFFP